MSARLGGSGEALPEPGVDTRADGRLYASDIGNDASADGGVPMRDRAPTGRPASRSIARNTIWNFAGVAVPVPIALIAIPSLIGRLGSERFGLLTIAWALMGYFGVFDFGLSRATTSYLARAIHHEDEPEIRRLFWSSVAAHLALGLAGGLFLCFSPPSLERALWVGAATRGAPRTTLTLLALSVPLLLLTSVSRG